MPSRSGIPNTSQFQPTRPLRGATMRRPALSRGISAFQPTRPLRGATRDAGPLQTDKFISTHAPLAGRDRVAFRGRLLRQHFNPRAPCGARLRAPARSSSRRWISTHAPLAGRDQGFTTPTSDSMIFQPTRPLRGATAAFCCSMRARVFQPTRPLRGATSASRWAASGSANFNPRAPCGARRATVVSS